MIGSRWGSPRRLQQLTPKLRSVTSALDTTTMRAVVSRVHHPERRSILLPRTVYAKCLGLYETETAEHPELKGELARGKGAFWHDLEFYGGYRSETGRRAAPASATAEADLPSLPALEPVPRPQLPIKTENVFPRLLVTVPDQPVELAEPAIP